MKGRQYMDRMISLLRCCYKSLEIALEDYPTQQTTSAAVTAKPVQLNDGKAGGMSVNVFSMGVCPASCTEPPTGPEPRSLGKRRRRRRRRRRPGIPDGIEEWVAKLEQELKQIKLQVAGQERRIAELEAEVTSSKGKNQKAKSPVQRSLPNMDGADPACQTVTRESTVTTGNPVPSFPDQKGQPPCPNPAGPGRDEDQRGETPRTRVCKRLGLTAPVRIARPRNGWLARTEGLRSSQEAHSWLFRRIVQGCLQRQATKGRRHMEALRAKSGS
jgi:hypothetical protein